MNIRAKGLRCCIVLLLIFSSSFLEAEPVDLTPDMAAPVPPPNDPNPPVANNEPNDLAIKIAVRSRFPVDTDTVTITVKQGVVLLDGFVTTDELFEEVVARSWTAPNVIDVLADRLKIKFPKKNKQDLMISAHVKGMLMVSDVLSKDMSTWPIQVEARKGKIYLSGIVQTRTMKENILRVVFSIPNIGTIYSSLKVK